MSKVILTRGLPASGKSTWAKAWVAADPSSRVRVNRDDIRFQLYGSYWGDGVDEQMVTKIENAMVETAISQGRDVVIDATHLAARYITRWRQMYLNIEVKDFEVPLLELYTRDDQRRLAGDRGVGVMAIRDMAQRYQIKADGKLPSLPEPPKVQTWTQAPKYQEGLDDAYIVDIDGTLADHTGIRSPYDTSKYHLDKRHVNVIQTVASLQLYGYDTIFVSGRDAAFMDVTVSWLQQAGLEVPALYMRPKGDERNDAIVKHELFHEHIAGKVNVIGVFDDRGRVLRMWRAIGLTTFAVGDTDNYNF